MLCLATLGEHTVRLGQGCWFSPTPIATVVLSEYGRRGGARAVCVAYRLDIEFYGHCLA